jgi:hypothetical protein
MLLELEYVIWIYPQIKNTDILFYRTLNRMSYTLSWHANGGSNTLHMNNATNPMGGIVTQSQIDAYTLPLGTYSYSAIIGNSSNDSPKVTIVDNANDNLIRMIIDNGTIPPWSGGNGPFTGSFTLSSQTNISIRYDNNYYMDNTAVLLELTLTSVPDAPNAPTNLSWVDLYNGNIRVSFTPGSDGGSTITNYVYSLDGGAIYTTLSPADSSSPITITGLSNRTNYSLVLKAVNGVGSGTASSPLALYYMCFLEGTKILCYNKESQQEEERSIETLRKGDLVKTALNGYKPIDTIGTSKIYNPSNLMRSLNRLYRCPKENYPALNEDLVITGCHSILVKNITEEERNTLIDIQEKIYVTEKHYRLIAAADNKAVPYEQEGVFNIWHFALEHSQYTFNYGVYANGLLVESSSMRMMREMSGMTLIE